MKKTVLKFYKEEKARRQLYSGATAGELFFLLDTKPSPNDLPRPFKRPVEVSTKAG